MLLNFLRCTGQAPISMVDLRNPGVDCKELCVCSDYDSMPRAMGGDPRGWVFAV